jgi:hypothetical protein
MPYAISVRAFDGWLSSPYHPITLSPHLDFYRTGPTFLWMTPHLEFLLKNLENLPLSF